MGVNGPTLRDVAKRANVSHMTVSLALRGRHGELGISAPVRDRVFKAVAELGYRPHRIGQALQSRRTGVLGFVVMGESRRSEPTLFNHTVHPFMVGMNHRLLRDQYHVAYLDLCELLDQDELPSVLRERFLDGLVVHFGLPLEWRSRFEKLNIPVLWWDSGVFEPFNCLFREECAVAREATRELLARGHRRIAYWLNHGLRGVTAPESDLEAHFSYRQRCEGYLQTMRDAGLDTVLVDGSNSELARAQFRQSGATAVVGSGVELLSVLTRSGVRWDPGVEHPVSVVSLDIEKRIPTHIAVGGMLYDRYACGSRAAELVLGMLEDPAHRVPTETVGPVFREGQTVHRAPDAQGR